jgi:hypothetical protein
MKWTNLDLRCAETAEDIFRKAGPKKKQDVNKVCIDAGSVLSGQGLYACYLFLWTKVPKEQELLRAELRQGSFSLLVRTFPGLIPPTSGPVLADKAKTLEGIRKLSEDLDSLLLAQRLTSQVLTYLRYHAKGVTAEVAAAGPVL